MNFHCTFMTWLKKGKNYVYGIVTKMRSNDLQIYDTVLNKNIHSNIYQCIENLTHPAICFWHKGIMNKFKFHLFQREEIQTRVMVKQQTINAFCNRHQAYLNKHDSGDYSRIIKHLAEIIRFIHCLDWKDCISINSSIE